MAIIKNLTPHAVNVIGEDGTIEVTFEPTGTVARATQQAEKVGELNGVNIVSMRFGETVDLPPYEQGTFYIVSVITLNAAQAGGRLTGDLLMTADPVRNDAGQIIGCRRLATQDPKGFYCSQPEHCNGNCKLNQANCFNQMSD